MCCMDKGREKKLQMRGKTLQLQRYVPQIAATPLSGGVLHMDPCTQPVPWREAAGVYLINDQ